GSKANDNEKEEEMSMKKLLTGLAVASCLMAGDAIAQKVITLWHPYNAETDMIHYGIKTFNESQKDYRIEARLVPYTQLTAEMIKAVATGTPPDLVTLNDRSSRASHRRTS